MIEGVYYETKGLAVGTAGTQKVTEGSHDLHYYLKENDDDTVSTYLLKPDGKVTKMLLETFPKADFEKRFKDCSTHECQFKEETKEDKASKEVAEKIRLGEKHLKNNEHHAATFEFGNALKKDKTNLKAHLGKGKAHVALGETDKAKEHFQEMSKSEELYDEEHKHLFNELGIELRKSKMFEEAIGNYDKAIGIDKDDPALYYNLARAYKEMGQKPDALESIKKAVELDPQFTEAEAFLKSLQ